MRGLLGLLATTALCANAAVIQGVVLDDETGSPLARTLVTLQPLAGQDILPAQVRAREHGEFLFQNVRPGWYLVRTSRRGFLPAESGQKRAGRPGIPFGIDSPDGSQFVQIRMYRLSAISGTVLDENGVGLPDMTVHVFTVKPVRHAGQGTTDDHGRFRVDGLNPGTYVVHTGTTVLEDETPLVPTWFKSGTMLAEAEQIRLRTAESFSDVAIRPEKGNVYRIRGNLLQYTAGPIQLTLITDMGRRVIATRPGAFMADNIPAGQVELVAESDECGAYETLSVQKDTYVQVVCGPLRPLSVNWTIKGRSGTAAVNYPLIVRRMDIDGTGPERELKPNEALLPGMWEIRAITGPEHYVESMAGLYASSYGSRSDDWFAVRLGTMLRVTLSAAPASIRGIVSTNGNPIAGAPVFLEWRNLRLREPELRLLGTRTDTRGNYSFNGLAPGEYRLLSSFDFDPEDAFEMNQAVSFNLGEGETKTQALEAVLP
jgi:hypothetical protein